MRWYQSQCAARIPFENDPPSGKKALLAALERAELSRYDSGALVAILDDSKAASLDPYAAYDPRPTPVRQSKVAR